MVVVAQLAVLDAELGEVVGRAEHGQPHPAAAGGPVDVEGVRVRAVLAELQQRPPPARGVRVLDAHVVGHQVEHEAQAVLVQRRHEPVQALAAAACLVDVRVVGGVVAVVAALAERSSGEA